MEEFAYEKPELGEEYEEPYPHFIAFSKGGMSLRFTLWPHKEPSNTRGRRYARLGTGDEMVSVFKTYAEDDVCGITRKGRVLCCNSMEINLLAGPGKGVKFIKVDAGDELIGAWKADVPVQIKRSSGGVYKLTGSDRKKTSRGGKGKPVVKRGSVKELELPLPDVPVLEEEE
jgi:DNA gyrase subunit A